MAWTASRGTIDSAAWLLFSATICWAVGYDTIYALQDIEDDRRIGVKSSALYFRDWTWLGVACAFAMMLACSESPDRWRGPIGASTACSVSSASGAASRSTKSERPSSCTRASNCFRNTRGSDQRSSWASSWDWSAERMTGQTNGIRHARWLRLSSPASRSPAPPQPLAP